MENYMHLDYETIIIGAGPAGLTAGKYLKNAIILDRKKTIGKPVQCGEGISINALKRQGITPNNNWICSKIHKIERIMPNGKSIGAWHQQPIGYIIDRKKFEQDIAKNIKCTIKLETKIVDVRLKNNYWEVTTHKGEHYKAKYIIGADGVNSIIRKKIFPNNQQKIEFIPAIEYLIKTEKIINTKIAKIFLNYEKYPQGYAWIFPKSQHLANIGIDGKSNLLNNIRNFLAENIKKNYGNYKIIENRSGVIPIKKFKMSIFKNNVFLIGDAGIFADPIFHGGIYQALASGKIAAQCVLNNQSSLYQSKIFAMPFNNSALKKIRSDLYSFDNLTLNKLGDILGGRGSRYLKTPAGLMQILKDKHLLKNMFRILRFFFKWKKYRDYLW